MTDEPLLHDRGRGPEIKGTRITVYDVLDYHKSGRPAEWIADLLRVTVPQVEAAVRYIESHRDEVMPAYEEMLERDRRGNPSHIEALLEKSHEKLLALKSEIEAKKKAKGPADAHAAG